MTERKKKHENDKEKIQRERKKRTVYRTENYKRGKYIYRFIYKVIN